MNEQHLHEKGEVSVFVIFSAIFRNRKGIAISSLTVGILAAISAAKKEPIFPASASFVSQSASADRTGLTSLAGQFGITVPANGQTSSPDFYIWLIKSRSLATEIVRDTFVVPELGGRPMSIYDIFKIGAAPIAEREQDAANTIGQLIKVESRKTTGVVQVTVSTPWPTVSLEIVSQIIKHVNRFNRETRRGQAAEERKFTEARLKSSEAELRAAEEDLQRFISSNQQISAFSEFAFRRDKLQRTTMLKQQVYTTLAQAYEDVRMREVRDTPVITIVEPPSVDARPASRGRLKLVFLGLMVGATIGVMLTLLLEWVRRLERRHDEEASEFVESLRKFGDAVRSRIQFLRTRE